MKKSEIALIGACGLLFFTGVAKYAAGPSVQADALAEAIALRTGSDPREIRPVVAELLKETGERQALFFALMACVVSALGLWGIAERRRP